MNFLFLSNWEGEKQSKSGIFQFSKSIFYAKNQLHLAENDLEHFMIASIFEALYFLKMCPNFDGSLPSQFEKIQNFI